ncbi:MAG: hypothetical protein JRN66_09010 [Nitrososphaerota archaeon]|nr:hypothetical protein [Nitrososphaerota archaeon]
MLKVNKSIAFEIAMIFVIPFIALRGLLFGGGFYAYSDQHWPLSVHVVNMGILWLKPLGGAGDQLDLTFTRIIVDWPYYLLIHLTSNIGLVERIFIYYTFVLYTVIALLFATFAVSKLYSGNNKIIAETIKLIIVLFIFSNLSALNLNADGGSFTDGLILIFMAISFLSFSLCNPRRAFMVATLLLNVSILLDPDYTTFFIITIIVGAAISGLINRDFTRRLGFAFLSSISSAITAVYLIIQLYLNSPLGSTLGAAATSARSFGSLYGGSSNINPLYVLILIGHAWSTMVFTSPNAILYANKISYIKGLMSPTQVILPPGFLTYVWIFTLIMIPFLSFLSLIFKKYQKVTLPAAGLAAIFLLMATVVYDKSLLGLEWAIVRIPVIGGTIGTTLSLPGHAINALASIYYVLFSVTVIGLLGKAEKISQINIMFSLTENLKKSFSFNTKKASGYLKTFTALFLIFIVLFSGWQAYNGTFWPARAPEVPYGNGVANIGAFSPVPINKSVLSAYNLISSLNENYGVIWVGGPIYSLRSFGLPEYGYAPQYSFLVQHDMKGALYYYLLYGGVKYFIISNDDILENITDIGGTTFQEAGFENYTQAQDFLSSVPGLKMIYNGNSVSVFEVENYTPSLMTNLLISVNQNSPYVAVLPYLFKTLGYNVSVSGNDVGASFTFGNLTGNYSIYTPVEALSLLHLKGENYNLSYNTTFGGVDHNIPVGLPDNFTLALWSNYDTYYNYSDGTVIIRMTNQANAYTTISYNGAFTGGPGGFYDPGDYVNLTVSFYAEAESPSVGSVIFMGEPSSNLYTDNVGASVPFNMSTSLKEYTFSYLFPPTDKYVDFRLSDLSSSMVIFKNITATYTTYPEILKDPNLPFGNYFQISNAVINANGYKILALMNNSNKYRWVNATNTLFINGTAELAALIFLKNNTELGEGKYLVYSYPALNDVRLSYNGSMYKPLPGLFGDSIFVLSGESNATGATIVLYGQNYMLAYFILILTFILIMFTLILKGYFKSKNTH